MTTAKAAEGWDLGEVLAVFRQIARDARGQVQVHRKATADLLLNPEPS